MERTQTNPVRGFTLIELLVSLAVGMIVIGAAVQLFSQGMAATFVVSQRAEMQQDVRAASGLLVKDIGLAGAGMPAGTSVDDEHGVRRRGRGTTGTRAGPHRLRERARLSLDRSARPLFGHDPY